LRPAGYDAEVVYLVALLQNLGRLISQYHLGDELQQIRRLMQPAVQAGESTEAGMSEQAASYAVLGTDIETIGAAVARHWGLDDSVLYLIRRLPLGTPPRTPENDDDMLRAVVSCANEAVDAAALPAPQAAVALARVAQRYARSLHIERDDLLDALKLPKPAQAAVNETADSELDRTA
jgi:non-specific serine/threonine protein kinase